MPGVITEASPREAIRTPLTLVLYRLGMAYDPGQIDATLAAAVGDDPVLVAELREAFLDGVKGGLSALETAADAAEWRAAAWRLRGLAGSFGAVRLMELATRLAEAPVGDRELMKRAHRAVARL